MSRLQSELSKSPMKTNSSPRKCLRYESPTRKSPRHEPLRRSPRKHPQSELSKSPMKCTRQSVSSKLYVTRTRQQSKKIPCGQNSCGPCSLCGEKFSRHWSHLKTRTRSELVDHIKSKCSISDAVFAQNVRQSLRINIVLTSSV